MVNFCSNKNIFPDPTLKPKLADWFVVGREHPKLPEEIGQSKVKSLLEEKNVKTVRVVFSNLSGVPCAKAWTASHIDDLLEAGVNIFKGNYFMCLGISPPPDSKYNIQAGDINLVPDLETFAVLPYEPGVAQVYGDFIEGEKPWSCCARSILKQTIAQLEREGMTHMCAGELEFYLTRKDSDSDRILPLEEHHRAPPFSTQGLDMANDFINTTIDSLQQLGVEVTRIIKEGGPGQYELNLKHREGVRAADDIMTLRQTIKALACRSALKATFMPKPFAKELGSGMHLHQSFYDSKTKGNLLVDERAQTENDISEFCSKYIGGILHHGRALCAIAASTVNSYKRLRPGWVAVDAMRFGKDDRGAAVRVPRVFDESWLDSTRIEYRVPDPACNPYLLMTSVIAAGLDGVKRGLSPEALPSGKVEEIDTKIPRSLDEAVQAFKEDSLFRDVFGSDLFEEYIKLKEFEVEIFRGEVTDMELAKYASAY